MGFKFILCERCVIRVKKMYSFELENVKAPY